MDVQMIRMDKSSRHIWVNTLTSGSSSRLTADSPWRGLLSTGLSSRSSLGLGRDCLAEIPPSAIILQWKFIWQSFPTKYEPPHDKINKMACAPSEDSDQPWHLSSLIRIFAVHMKKAWVLSYPLSVQWRLWSDWVDALADPSLHWPHSHFVGFVMRQLIWQSQVAQRNKATRHCYHLINNRNLLLIFAARALLM